MPWKKPQTENLLHLQLLGYFHSFLHVHALCRIFLLKLRLFCYLTKCTMSNGCHRGALSFWWASFWMSLEQNVKPFSPPTHYFFPQQVRFRKWYFRFFLKVSLIQNVEKTSQLNLHHYLSQRRFQSLCYVHAFLPLTEDWFLLAFNLHQRKRKKALRQRKEVVCLSKIVVR